MMRGIVGGQRAGQGVLRLVCWRENLLAKVMYGYSLPS